jgi:hypothetical protein
MKMLSIISTMKGGRKFVTQPAEIPSRGKTFNTIHREALVEGKWEGRRFKILLITESNFLQTALYLPSSQLQINENIHPKLSFPLQLLCSGSQTQERLSFMPLSVYAIANLCPTFKITSCKFPLQCTP